MRKMKDSGIEWIGEIPKEWNRTSILNVLRKKITDGPHETPNLVENGIPFISVDSLNDSKRIDLSVCKKFITQEDFYEYSEKTQIEKGDILFSKAATIGKTAIVYDEIFMVWSPLAIIKVDESLAYNKYLYYVLNCPHLIKNISLSGSINTQINVGMRELEKAQIPVPPLYEQQTISAYLDDKCTKIDTIIEKQQKIIKKLKKYKLSLITETVTKGLNSEVSMKDSGIEWIGEINDTYFITKIGKLCFVTKLAGFEYTDTMVNNISIDSDVPIVRAQNVRMFRFNKETINEYIDLSTSLKLNRCALTKKALLITFIGAGIGDVCIIDEEDRFHLAPNVAKIEIRGEFKKTLLEEYLMYYIGSYAGKSEIFKIAKASAQPSLSMETIRGIKIVLPNLEEQQEIVDYLDKKCSAIDSSIEKKQAIINKLKEYKKSLIYEYVTGKQEVK
ncbi:MAG: restriction endonuclease subunit S [Ruminococcus sp.]|nr:restriction endonuclease subunit S [Ruminococcus sp.]